MTYTNLVTRAIESIGPDKNGYTAAALASAVGETRDTMTVALAQYRHHQKSMSNPKFIVACEGYGTGARWYVLHAEDTAYVNKPERRNHGYYIVRDAVTRYLRDYLMELEPGLNKRSRAADKVALAAAKQIMAQMEAVAGGMAAQLKLVHQPVVQPEEVEFPVEV